MPDEIEDGQAASSTATEEQELADLAAGGGQPEVDPETGVPFSEHPRWKEIYGNLKEFKALGASPEQLKGALDRLAYYDQLAAEARQEAGKATPTDEQREIAAKRQQVIDALEAAVPGITKIPEYIEQQTVKEKYQVESLRERAEAELAGLMTKAGMPTEADDVLMLSAPVQAILMKDKKLATLYWTDPAAAVRVAWKHFMDRVAAPLSRGERAAAQQKGVSLSSLPRAGQGGGGGSPGTKGTAPPQTIDELFKQSKGLLIGKE